MLDLGHAKNTGKNFIIHNIFYPVFGVGYCRSATVKPVIIDNNLKRPTDLFHRDLYQK